MILVDGAVWEWRDRRWAHLVSDRDYPELHAFARALGLARVAFQGDHYDVDEATRLTALAAGAEPVDARELLRRLRSAGLRRPAATRPWRWRVVAEWPLSSVVGLREWPTEAAPLLEDGLAGLVREWAKDGAAAARALRVMSRPGERAAVVVDLIRGPAPPLAELVVEVVEVVDAPGGATGPAPSTPSGPGRSTRTGSARRT